MFTEGSPKICLVKYPSYLPFSGARYPKYVVLNFIALLFSSAVKEEREQVWEGGKNSGAPSRQEKIFSSREKIIGFLLCVAST